MDSILLFNVFYLCCSRVMGLYTYGTAGKFSLNFTSIFVTGKVEHNLSAARKKDIDDSNGYKQHHRDPPPVNPRGQRSKPDSVLQASK